jgi:hypothetical protein
LSNLLRSVVILFQFCSTLIMTCTCALFILLGFDDAPSKMISRSQDMFVAGVFNVRAGRFIYAEQPCADTIVRGRHDVLPICVSNHQIHLNGSY